MIKEIIFYCWGDTTKASTWSNVPYLFTKTLENKGYIVRRINLNSYHLIEKFWNKIVCKIIGLFFPNHQYYFVRTHLCRFLTNLKILQTQNQYRDADLCISTSFNFCVKKHIPNLLFSDWTFDILISDRLKRKPYFFEQEYIYHEEKSINKADYVISLFPICSERMKQKLPDANIIYLGGNVINLLYSEELIENDIIIKKISSKKILFIGSPKYKNGCTLLIETMRRLPVDYELHIIGLHKEEFEDCPNNIHFYGYLRKDNPEENRVYYDLLLTAKIIVNPTPLWSGYSSIVEAMFFYTPIIISPFEDFVKEFGEQINMGLYNKVFTTDCLARNIETIINYDTEQYRINCINAHNMVKDYTWDRYVSKILDCVINRSYR